MIVRKCDRCGAYVDREFIPKICASFTPNTFVTSSKDIKMDLCYECYAELEKFLKIDKEEISHVD